MDNLKQHVDMKDKSPIDTFVHEVEDKPEEYAEKVATQNPQTVSSDDSPYDEAEPDTERDAE